MTQEQGNVRRAGTAVLIGAALCWAAGAQAAVPRGIVLIPIGSVQVLSAQGAGSWLGVRRPVRLQQGDEVRTGDGASAQILLSDGSKLSLSEDAHLSIKSTDVKSSVFELGVGKLKAYFAGIFASRMTVRTPTAVCAVRGTEFDLSADPQGQTNVKVDEGHLEVSDNRGQTAVVTDEETVSIGKNGMQPPHLVSLNEGMEAVRPTVIQRETARDATRTMIEEMRNRELKANEAQLGEDLIDAFGRRVRLEEYLLRPAGNEFQLLFLNSRSNSFNWGTYTETFHTTLPNDISQIPAVIAGTFYSPTMPSNWLTNIDFYATNTVDFIHETVALGNPVPVSFAGYGLGTLYYPATMDHEQWLGGPGVPGGLREQFDESQSVSGNVFTWTQSIIDNTGTNIPATLDQFQLDASNSFDVTVAGGCGLGSETCFDHSPAASNAFGSSCTSSNQCGDPTPNFAGFVPGVTEYPNGPSKADELVSTIYPDGSSVSAEKILVDTQGNILDFNTAGTDFNSNGNYNLEDVITSSLFQGRDIDVVISPKIFSQESQASTTGSSLQP